ncbi:MULTISPECIES: hypothetical protein [Pseudomonas]|nr:MULTISPECIES: hypothetical protein [Pseudomonas]
MSCKLEAASLKRGALSGKLQASSFKLQASSGKLQEKAAIPRIGSCL